MSNDASVTSCHADAPCVTVGAWAWGVREPSVLSSHIL